MPVNLAKKEAVVENADYDIISDRKELTTQYEGSQEVDALTTQIDVGNLETISTFGASAANEVAKVSDSVLNSMNLTTTNKSGEMLNALSTIMKQFDIDEIKKEPGKLEKLFGNAKKKLEGTLKKYHSMGDEVDKIYTQLCVYESEIEQSNRQLSELFNSNVTFYHELVKYILAGEQGCREIQEAIDERTKALETSGDQSIRFEIQTLQGAHDMLAQRTQDLRTAEMIAIQSIPMLKAMEVSNMNLVRKINSAFIVTLPVFKQALAQAIMLKQQRLQAEALQELDKQTNEMLLKNAQNTSDQLKLSAQMASGSSIKVETLEQTWKTICSGIDETERIQEEARQKRLEDQRKLETIKGQYAERFGKK